MHKRITSAVLALLVCASAAASSVPQRIQAADSYDLEILVDADASRKPISPYLYGVNSDFRKEEYLYAADGTSARQGGNRFSGYNWEINASNAGRDYLHYSDAYLVDFDKEQLAVPGAPALGFAREAAAKNVPYKITTVQMAGYAAADTAGEITEDEIAPSPRWVEVKPTKGSEFSLTPDTTDGVVYIDEYVNYLVENLGDAESATGYQAYNLDNEPSLWSATHARMHPDKVTCEEIITKSKDYAAAIKAVDPKAEIFGLALYGMPAYLHFNNAPDWEEHSADYDWFLSYYLDEMAKAEQEHGKRLVDVLDIHYYSEAKGECRVTECEDPTHTSCIEARVQAPRTLWDPTYLEVSWLADNYPEFMPVFRHVQNSIDTYYPDTKIALTEYNFGGGNQISGAVAQADALGVFAENGVYVSNLWAINSDFSYQLSAIDLYTNYDGNGSAFGNTLLTASSSNIEKGTVYAAIDGTDESRMTMVLTNKSVTETQNAHITLDSSAEYSSAKVYGITGDSSEIQLLSTVDNIADNQFTLEVPAMTVVQIELTADDYTMRGDVNEDGSVDAADVRALNDFLLAKPDAVISAAHAELTEDGSVNAFDLAALKKLLHSWGSEPAADDRVGYWATKDGQWRIRNGMGGQTVTMRFRAQAGNYLKLAYGYWDPNAVNEETGNAGVWIHGDTTQLGKHQFDENGELLLNFTIPDGAKSVELMIYNYTDESGDTVVQLEKSAVALDSVTISGN